MNEPTRVELPLNGKSRLFSRCRTIGDLRHKYKNLKFVKYIYVDPKDSILKGANPSDDLVLVDKASITVSGDLNHIIQFSEDATLA